MKQYHHIFLALPDIYRDAGPFALKELASKTEGRRNLLVLPAAFDKIMKEHQGGRVTISDLEKKSRPGSQHLLSRDEVNKYVNDNPETNEYGFYYHLNHYRCHYQLYLNYIYLLILNITIFLDLSLIYKNYIKNIFYPIYKN